MASKHNPCLIHNFNYQFRCCEFEFNLLMHRTFATHFANLQSLNGIKNRASNKFPEFQVITNTKRSYYKLHAHPRVEPSLDFRIRGYGSQIVIDCPGGRINLAQSSPPPSDTFLSYKWGKNTVRFNWFANAV